jgi:hypothetical protein
MGIVTSRPDEGGALYLRDQNRRAQTPLTIAEPASSELR